MKFNIALVVLVIGAILVSSCGRKGGLEPPAAKVKTEQEKNRPDTFIFDPLIQ